MAVTAVVFDVGETLIDETGPWGHLHATPAGARQTASLTELV
jgi:hypothetical protein